MFEPFQVVGKAWSMKMSFFEDFLAPMFSSEAVSKRLLTLRWDTFEDLTIFIHYLSIQTWPIFRSGVDVADLANAVYGAIERYSDENLDWKSGESP